VYTALYQHHARTTRPNSGYSEARQQLANHSRYIAYATQHHPTYSQLHLWSGFAAVGRAAAALVLASRREFPVKCPGGPEVEQDQSNGLVRQARLRTHLHDTVRASMIVYCTSHARLPYEQKLPIRQYRQLDLDYLKDAPS